MSKDKYLACNKYTKKEFIAHKNKDLWIINDFVCHKDCFLAVYNVSKIKS